MARRKDSNDDDDFSDTTSELATAIHSSSFASSFASQPRRPADSTMAQAAGGGPTETSSSSMAAQPRRTSASRTSLEPQQAEDNDSNDETRKRTIGMFAIVAIVIAVAAAFLSTRTRRADANADNPTAAVDQVIQQVTSNAALRDTDSPQSKARNWMIGVDQLTEQIVEEGLDRIHQRYALATFYFATQGPTRWNRMVGTDEPAFDFVNPTTSECQWFGVLCASETTISTRRKMSRLLQDTAVNPISVANINNTVFALVMPNRNLTGQLPPELGSITYLRRIDLSSNQLSGIIPESMVRSMKDLWWLDLSDNRFTGSIPRSLWRLPKLSHLFLFKNVLSGRIEREPLPNTMPTTTSSAFSDGETIPQPPFQPLKQVYLYENQLTGPMPTWFHELNGLEDWLAYRNQLTGTLPQVQPEQLSFYDLSYNRFTGTIPESLWATFPPPPLETLYLEYNRLTGSIPNTTIPQPFLNMVSLHNNRLSGRIPEGFGIHWSNLKEFRVQNNTISGPIPPTFWRHPQSPPKLTHLNLSYNRFSGTLPNSTEARGLQEVRLHENGALRGNIPDRFGYSWPNLTVLEIQATSLTGRLGPLVEVAGDEVTECPNVWAKYSEFVTSFRFSAYCRKLLVTDPDPPVECFCCTNCVKESTV